MHFSIIATVAALSSLVLGQGNLANIPTCAQSCFGTSNLGSCSLLDVACICGSSTITKVACCVLSSCNAADINSTITFAETLCKGAGVTLNTTPDCSSASSSASASASSSASASAASSASASASRSASVTGISGTNTPSGSAAATTSRSGSASATAAGSTAAAAFQTAGAGLGLGVAVIGMLAAL